MRLLRRLALPTLACVLAGCLGGLLPKSGERAAYALAEPLPLAAASTLAGGLLVELPRALPPVDGVDLVVVRANGEVQRLPAARWIAPIPELLQQMIARQLEAAGSATVVSQSPQAHALPLRLGSDLQAFQLQELDDGSLAVHAAISVRLSCAPAGRILAGSTTLTADAAAVAAGSEAAIAALRAAATQLGQKLVAWLDQVDARFCS